MSAEFCNLCRKELEDEDKVAYTKEDPDDLEGKETTFFLCKRHAQEKGFSY